MDRFIRYPCGTPVQCRLANYDVRIKSPLHMILLLKSVKDICHFLFLNYDRIIKFHQEMSFLLAESNARK